MYVPNKLLILRPLKADYTLSNSCEDHSALILNGLSIISGVHQVCCTIQISGLHLYGDPHSNFARILRWLGEPSTAKKAKFSRGPACLPGQAISLALIKSKVTPISSLLHTGLASEPFIQGDTSVKNKINFRNDNCVPIWLSDFQSEILIIPSKFPRFKLKKL